MKPPKGYTIFFVSTPSSHRTPRRVMGSLTRLATPSFRSADWI